MELINGKYSFEDGLDPIALCQTYGTPLYVYEASSLTRQYARIVDAFPYPHTKIHFACKALTNLAILRLFKNMGAGLDCVSIEEIEMGLSVGFAPEDILYTPNFPSSEELERAVAIGVKINLDSLLLLENWGLHHPEIPFGIRINPHLMAGGNDKISVGHIDSKFGISIHQLPHALRLIESQGLKVRGLHMHTGSDILDVDVFMRGTEIILEAALKFSELEYIDLGSGFKVPYKPDDIETDIEELGEKLSARIRQFSQSLGHPVALYLEPGKFLVSQAGYFFARCTGVKQTTSTSFVGLDTGFNHLVRPMFYGSFHKIVNVTEPNFKPRIYNVVGNICETDTFASDRRISEVVEGDILGFYNAGAYGWMMASNYNSRPRPAEVLLLNGSPHLIRKRETIEDLTRLQLIPEEILE